MQSQVKKHVQAVQGMKLSQDETLRQRIFKELVRKRVKNGAGTPDEEVYEKYMKLSNQMNTNEL